MYLRYVMVFFVVFFLTGLDAMAIEFEVPQNRKVTEILPAETISGPHYSIRKNVASYGYMYHYTVDSDLGVFKDLRELV
ncbi:MAG: hypothetical protein JRJ43_11600 [Deltaproteobacteria bacterium]|nr:hypothetical protein [Deltaproteobacteria bacterium]MBW1720179.1 hypothetical protein [Deltaproteobacteria bacterium]MBW2081154.1 hypothetical protein [Deltaproteobacteria bacterium]MBW2351307.1 hypothetical protein [Deltaproteobacteria bacterium]